MPITLGAPTILNLVWIALASLATVLGEVGPRTWKGSKDYDGLWHIVAYIVYYRRTPWLGGTVRTETVRPKKYT